MEYLIEMYFEEVINMKIQIIANLKTGYYVTRHLLCQILWINSLSTSRKRRIFQVFLRKLCGKILYTYVGGLYIYFTWLPKFNKL